MQAQDGAPGYHIWGVDHTAYGPVELPALVSWIKDERVLAETWVYVENDQAWCKACEVPELAMFFRPKATVTTPRPTGFGAQAPPKPGSLRRVKALAEMADDQLACVLKHTQFVQVRPFTHLIQKGAPSDAMYGVLEGELRSCLIVDGKECPLATLVPGSIFGEISLFDKGPHVADVISNKESVLVKITAADIRAISQESADAALGLMLGLVKAVAGRVRTLTKRYEDSVQIVHRSDEIVAA